MALVTKITFYLTLILFFFGQLFRLNFSNFSFPLFSLALLILAFFNFLSQKNIRLKLKNPATYFIIFSLITLIFNWFKFSFSVSSLFYWLRLSSLLSFFIFPLKIDHKIDKFFQLILWATLIFGFIQYILWPDFTTFSALNWDPHLYRLVGTFFDPTFIALIFLLFILKIYFQYSSNKLLIFLPYLGLALTYSRSSLLALFVVFSYISFKSKKPFIFLSTFLLIFLTIVLLPRMPGEGTKLERTSSIKAKIVNYKEGLKLFSTSPLIGLGYNNLSVIRANSSSHANSGFDGSLLTVTITTGVVGLFLFSKIFTSSLNSSTLYWQSLLIAIFFHSLFANSLLYPWILFYLVLEFKYRKSAR